MVQARFGHVSCYIIESLLLMKLFNSVIDTFLFVTERRLADCLATMLMRQLPFMLEWDESTWTQYWIGDRSINLSELLISLVTGCCLGSWIFWWQEVSPEEMGPGILETHVLRSTTPSTLFGDETFLLHSTREEKQTKMCSIAWYFWLLILMCGV